MKHLIIFSLLLFGFQVTAAEKPIPVMVQKKSGKKLLVVFPKNQKPDQQRSDWILGYPHELRSSQALKSQYRRRTDRFEVSASYEGITVQKAENTSDDDTSELQIAYLQAFNFVRYEIGPQLTVNFAKGEDSSLSTFGVGLVFEFNFVANDINHNLIPALGITYLHVFGSGEASSTDLDVSGSDSFMYLCVKWFPWDFANVAIVPRFGLYKTQRSYDANGETYLDTEINPLRFSLGLAGYY